MFWGKDILVYGAGGVARDLIILLKSCMSADKISIAVTNTSGNPDNIYNIPVNSIEKYKNDTKAYMVIVATMPDSSAVIRENLLGQGFEDVILVDEVIDDLYKDVWSEPIQNNKILFSHFGAIGYGGNGKYISELLAKEEGLDIVWATKNDGGDYPGNVRTVAYGSYEYYKELATARVWVDDQHKSFFTRKREGQYYIQTWHGIGPIKKIEYDADNLPKSYLRLTDLNSEMEDVFISASSFNTEQCRRAFHYNGEIIECGYPRNDVLFDKAFDVEGLKEKLGIAGKKAVLYAPTFREDDKLIYPDYDVLVDALSERFGGKFVLLLRLHPNDKSGAKIEDTDKLINVTKYDDVQELIRISDILVTDYSSIMWDFSLQRRPVFLFHPDDMKYQVERGNYLKFTEMPYIETVDDLDLKEKIMTFDEEDYLRRLEAFFDTYKSFDQGDAAKTIAELILSKL